MNQELEFADAFLRHTHPVEDGWDVSQNMRLNGVLADYFYKRYDVIRIININMSSPFVSKEEVERAKSLMQTCKEKYPEASIKIKLLYGRLLMKPHNLPKNVYVLSVTEEGTYANRSSLS